MVVDVSTSYLAFHGACDPANNRHLLFRNDLARVLREGPLARLRTLETHKLGDEPADAGSAKKDADRSQSKRNSSACRIVFGWVKVEIRDLIRLQNSRRKR